MSQLLVLSVMVLMMFAATPGTCWSSIQPGFSVILQIQYKNLWVTATANHLKLEHWSINFPHKKRGLKIQNGTKTLQMNQPAPQPKMTMLWVVTVHSLFLTSSSLDMIHWAFSPGKSYFSTKRPELKCHSSFMLDQKKKKRADFND